jgi:hypothetical protein
MAKKDPKRAADGQGVKRQDLVLEIAKKVGKSARYVYARMKLCELIPELQKDLLEGRIDASHADELVRLTRRTRRTSAKRSSSWMSLSRSSKTTRKNSSRGTAIWASVPSASAT